MTVDEAALNVGDEVVFAGHGYRRAIQYGYSKLFGGKTYTVTDVRTSCCNRFVVLDGVDGMYNSVFFKKAEDG